jgi:ABC-type nickel/cobalt efflux system permease component RcnA
MALVGLFIFVTRFKKILGSYSKTVIGVCSVKQGGSKDCNHQHGPQQSDLQNPLNLRSTFGIIASIGVRPCSGALIVLLLSYSLNIPMAGVFSVLAMSIGTALMISALAIFSVYLRQLANRFVMEMPDSNGWFFRFPDLLGGLGGLFIFVFGISLLTALLSQPAHPFR